jgi:hypothetical protein
MKHAKNISKMIIRFFEWASQTGEIQYLDGAMDVFEIERRQFRHDQEIAKGWRSKYF